MWWWWQRWVSDSWAAPPSKAYPESSISAAILPTTSQARTTFIFSTGRLLVVPYSWFSSLNGTLAKSIHCYQKQQPSEISMMLSYLDSPGLCLFNTPTHPIFVYSCSQWKICLNPYCLTLGLQSYFQDRSFGFEFSFYTHNKFGQPFS